MMTYVWNIVLWAKQYIAVDLAQSPMNEWLAVLVKPLNTVYGYFMAHREATIRKMRFNSQTIVLENLLNDLFDPTLRRIIIINRGDTNQPVYIYQSAENKPLYIYQESELVADPSLNTFVGTDAEYGTIYHFIVQAAVGSLTSEEIVRLKATVNYYRFSGKVPYYQYDDLTPF